MLNYLVVEDFSGQPVPFIFPIKVAHEDMRLQLPYGKVISGGVVALGPNGFVCSGGSPELGITARKDQDAALLAGWLQNGFPDWADPVLCGR